MFENILVSLDGSELAEQALPTAVKLAQSGKGSITLLHVLEHRNVLIPEGPDMLGHNLYTPQTSHTREEIAAKEYLNGMEASVTGDYSDLTCHTRLEEGDPASQIVDVAAELAVDLVVMSTHGYSGFTRWMLGSVAEKVTRHGPCPVLVVRADTPIQQILITLDGSDLAESSLPFGLAIAHSFGASVTLFRVDDVTDKVEIETIEDLNKYEKGLGDQMRQRIQQKVTDYLEQVRLRHDHEDLKLQTTVRFGEAAPTILKFVEENEIDLVVMSTHGRTGLARWRYGSVTEKVLRQAECAMLIYRPEEMVK